jgi:rhomboid protease GluP
MVRVNMPTVKPYATYILLAVTIFIYLLQIGTQSLLGTDWPFQLGAKYGPLIRIGEIWRLITPVFLHGSFLHIAFNMYALFIYGRGLEERFGHGRFLLLYFLSAYAGNVLSFLLVPNPSLGASTAIFGLLTAEVIFLIQNRSLLGNRVNSTIWNLLFIAGYNLFIGFTTQGVDNFGHIGGLLGGLLFTWFGGPRWKVEGIYPMLSLVDEREGHGALSGTVAVLLIFIPLAALGWFWVGK